MRDLDETDLEILQLLLADVRRPYSDIAEAVGLSAPAASDRVDRLQEAGVINRFTLDIDRSQLRSGIPVLMTPALAADGPDVESGTTLLEAGAVEHVFTTAEADLVAFARVPDNDIAGWLADTVEDGIEDVSVTLLAETDWSPDLDRTGVLPEDKSDAVEAIRVDGRKAMMVDDGVNDAPALAVAYVGTAIGSGTDVAIEAADVTLMRDDPPDAVKAIRISGGTLAKINRISRCSAPPDSSSRERISAVDHFVDAYTMVRDRKSHSIRCSQNYRSSRRATAQAFELRV